MVNESVLFLLFVFCCFFFISSILMVRKSFLSHTHALAFTWFKWSLNSFFKRMPDNGRILPKIV